MVLILLKASDRLGGGPLFFIRQYGVRVIAFIILLLSHDICLKPWLTVHSSTVTCQLIRLLLTIHFIYWEVTIVRGITVLCTILVACRLLDGVAQLQLSKIKTRKCTGFFYIYIYCTIHQQ